MADDSLTPICLHKDGVIFYLHSSTFRAKYETCSIFLPFFLPIWLVLVKIGIVVEPHVFYPPIGDWPKWNCI